MGTLSFLRLDACEGISFRNVSSAKDYQRVRFSRRG